MTIGFGFGGSSGGGGGGGGGATNLSVANSGASTLDVASDTGTDATIPAATTGLAGLETAADKTKLNGIEVGATADQVASEVPFTPTGNTVSTDVQSAIVELQTEIDGLGGGGATNLAVANITGTTLDVTSSTGTDATIPAVTTTTAGLMTAADKTTLDGLGAGAGLTHPQVQTRAWML